MRYSKETSRFAFGPQAHLINIDNGFVICYCGKQRWSCENRIFRKIQIKRLKTITNLKFRKLTLFYSAEFAEDKVKIAEGFVHGLSNQHRTSGEWFSISVEEAIWRIDYALIFHS